jgi:acetoacetate decarboxylase
MNQDELKAAFSMPICSPSFPKGPYRFINREYLIITYTSSPEAIRHAVPEPLEPDGSNTVLYEFIKMPDSSGFGDYEESGIVIPCRLGGNPVNFTAQMYLDCHPPIAGGREIWGFPKKDARPRLRVIQETLTGKLYFGEQLVALATMGYKHDNVLKSSQIHQEKQEGLSKTQVNLKMIPDATGTGFDALQLVGYNLTDIQLKGMWTGPARLHLVPHVGAPVADLPVLKICGGLHFIADITLPMGRVLHNYLQ